jgi:nudix-type nucleoside diphosphatase (YffH/AdpP family)
VTGYRIAEATTLYEGRRNLLKLTVQLPDGQMVEREVLDAPDAAAVLPFDRERRTVVLIRQFRAPIMYREGDPSSLEAVAGLLDGDEPPEDCARRETMEEAGLRVDLLEPAGVTWSAPGFTMERVHLFLAPYASAARVAKGGGLADENEDIEVLEIGVDELAGMLAQNAISDLKTLALVQALRIRHPDLFGMV